MNDAHLTFLASPDWAAILERDHLPWIDSVAELGDHLLEVGPGPGLTTDLLRTRCSTVTAVELDEDLAQALADRMAGTNVEVVQADAAATGFDADRFSAAVSLSMLHHVPTAEQQDAVLAEVLRVLRPGAPLLVIDSRNHDVIRAFHDDDVYNPLPVETLPARLEALGFADVELELTEYELKFRATKP